MLVASALSPSRRCFLLELFFFLCLCLYFRLRPSLRSHFFFLLLPRLCFFLRREASLLRLVLLDELELLLLLLLLLVEWSESEAEWSE